MSYCNYHFWIVPFRLRFVHKFILFIILAHIYISYFALAHEDAEDISIESLLNTNIDTVSKYDQTINSAPASITIITPEHIRRYGYQSLDEILMSIRGFYISNDRNYSYIGVRGFNRHSDYNNRVLLLINGHTMNESVYGSVAAGNDLGLCLDAIDRIEIIRGPSSVLYGTGAMFAIINIVTKKGYSIDGARFISSLGSYRKLQGSLILGKEIKNNLDLFTTGILGDIKGQDLYFKEYDDPSTNNGIAEDLDWEKYHGVLASVNYDNLVVHGLLSSRKKGVPTASWETIFNDKRNETLDERGFLELKYSKNYSSDKRLTLKGYYDYYIYKGLYPYEPNEQYEFSEGRWIGGEASFQWDIKSNNRLITGMEIKDYFHNENLIWDKNKIYFDGNFPYKTVSIYMQDEYQFTKNLSLITGIRCDLYSDIRSPIIPRIAVIYNPVKSGGTLKLLYGEAFRVPNLYEVYYEDEYSTKSNLKLKPERIKTTELIWEQSITNNLSGFISVYDYRIKDLIDQVIDLSDGLTQHRNIGRVKANGLELELNANKESGLQWYINYSYQNAKDLDLNIRLTDSPVNMAKAGISLPVIKHLYLTAEIIYETERGTVYETKTEPYFLANINISTKTIFNHIRFSFLVKNLFDTYYTNPGCFEHKQDSIAQNGRNFTLKMEYKF